MLNRVSIIAVEPLDGPHQAEVPLLDQVLQAQPLAQVAPRDVDHQAEVGLDHVLAGIRVAGRDPLGQLALLLGREQRRVVDVLEIDLEG